MAYTCPKGHSSTEPDFCSECGSKIQAAPAPAAGGATPEATVDKCPDCGAPRLAGAGKFCEVCGYNFTTGARGEILSAVSQPTGWRVVVSVDPSLWEEGSPEPPAEVGPFDISLDKPVNLIGRRSPARGIFPEISLNHDEAVSHRHALIERGPGGGLILRDIGASNGTRLNGKDLEPMRDAQLKDGDQITLGHWTRITVKAVS